MATHTLTTKVEVSFIPVSLSEIETAYPTIEIEYKHTEGAPQTLWEPADPDEIEFVSASLIDGDGLVPTKSQIDEWAMEWLATDHGYEKACENAY